MLDFFSYSIGAFALIYLVMLFTRGPKYQHKPKPRVYSMVDLERISMARRVVNTAETPEQLDAAERFHDHVSELVGWENKSTKLIIRVKRARFAETRLVDKKK